MYLQRYRYKEARVIYYKNKKLSTMKKEVIRCAPLDSEGIRQIGAARCDERCPFWDRCLGELKVKEPQHDFVEFDPTPHELTLGFGHLNEVGEIKVWKKIPKNKK